MADTTPETPTETSSGSPEIQINVKGPSELKLQISISTDKTVYELKQAIASKSDVEADRQRLIYSGRVLKNEDTLSSYKVQSNHTIHMVKGAATAGPSSSSSAPAATATQPLPTMQTGQNPHDPLTLLNSHMGYGAMAGLNPFADLGVNQNDPNMLQTMMNSPQFLQQMSTMMSNPAIMDQIIASNPQLAAMGPQVRQAFQSEEFRQIMSNPQRLQQMMQMAQMFGGMGGAGAGGLGNPFGAPPAAGFPAPGVPGAAAGATPSTTPAAGTTPGAPPALGAAPGADGLSSLLDLMYGPVGGAGVGAGAGTPGAGAGAVPPNPFGNPALLQHLMAGGGGPFGGGFGGLGAGLGGAGLGATGTPGATPGTPSAVPVGPPPEERFQVQLQQLQDMGFTNASQNIRALLATGGNVHSAIEYILGGGGL